MSFEQWIALINAIATPIVAIAVAYFGRRIMSKVEEVHKQTNSMKDALVESTAKASLAEGHAAGLSEGTAVGLGLQPREIEPISGTVTGTVVVTPPAPTLLT